MCRSVSLSGAAIDSIAIAYWKRPSVAFRIDYGHAIAAAENEASIRVVRHSVLGTTCFRSTAQALAAVELTNALASPSTLDAINSNDDRRQSSTRRARSVVVDEEHLSASERRKARRAAQRGSSVDRVASSQMVWSVNGFVTVGLHPRFPEALTATWAT